MLLTNYLAIPRAYSYPVMLWTEGESDSEGDLLTQSKPDNLSILPLMFSWRIEECLCFLWVLLLV